MADNNWVQSLRNTVRNSGANVGSIVGKTASNVKNNSYTGQTASASTKSTDDWVKSIRDSLDSRGYVDPRYQSYELKLNDGRVLGTVSYGAKKAIENNTLDRYKPRNAEESSVLEEYKTLTGYKSNGTSERTKDFVVSDYTPGIYSMTKEEYNRRRQSNLSLPEFGSYEYFKQREEALRPIMDEIAKDFERRDDTKKAWVDQYINNKNWLQDADESTRNEGRAEAERLVQKFNYQDAIIAEYKAIDEQLKKYEVDGIHYDSNGNIDTKSGSAEAKYAAERYETLLAADAMSLTEMGKGIHNQLPADKQAKYDANEQMAKFSAVELEKAGAYDYYEKNKDKEYDDGFFGRVAGNAKVGRIGIKSNNAGYASYDASTDDIEASEVYQLLSDRIQKNNASTFQNDTKGQQLLASFSQYIPQAVDQLTYEAIGRAVGIAAGNYGVGNIVGAAGSAGYMFRQTAGASFLRMLQESELSTEDAKALAQSEALPSSIVEFGLSAVTGMLWKGANFSTKGALSSSVSKFGESATKRAVSGLMMKGVSEKGAKLIVNSAITAAKVAIDGAGEGFEELIQEGMSITADRYAAEGKTASPFDLFLSSFDLSQYSKDDFKRMGESFLIGTIIGFGHGGIRATTSSVTNKTMSNISDAVDTKRLGKAIIDSGNTPIVTSSIEAIRETASEQESKAIEKIETAIAEGKQPSARDVGSVVKSALSKNSLTTETVAVGDKFKDTGTGRTITIVERDDQNTTFEIDTGRKTISKVFSNKQADAMVASDILEKIESVVADTSVDDDADVETVATPADSATSSTTTKTVPITEEAVVGGKDVAESDTEVEIDEIEAFENMLVEEGADDVTIKKIMSNAHTIKMALAGTGKTLQDFYNGVSFVTTDSTGTSANSKSEQRRKAYWTTVSNAFNKPANMISNEYVDMYVSKADGKVAVVTDAINNTLRPGAQEVIFQALESQGLKGDMKTFAKALRNKYIEKGNIGSLADYFSDNGREVMFAIDRTVDATGETKATKKTPKKATKKSVPADTTTEAQGVKVGDVYVDNETGDEFTVVARDDKNTTIRFQGQDSNIETQDMENEVADGTFTVSEIYTKANKSKESATTEESKSKKASKAKSKSKSKGKKADTTTESEFIDDRTWDEVGNRKVNAFQFDNPEVKPFYKEIAQELLSDLKDTVKGERYKTGSYEMGNEEWTGVSRMTSEAIAKIKDTSGATYENIEDALERIIHDKGQENIALAKRIELVIDDMLTDGYTDFEGNKIPPNKEYLELKSKLGGREYNATEDDGDISDLPLGTEERLSLSSMGSTFFGNEDITADEFQAMLEDGSYKEHKGYREYVKKCVSAYAQSRGIKKLSESNRAEIERQIEGIINVAIAAKKAGYDIYDDGSKRGVKDSKKRLLFSSLEPNSDYITSSDISAICDKRKNFADIYDAIVKLEESRGVPKDGRFFSNVDNYFILHKLMAEKGLTIPCEECYVESMRKNLAPMANSFIELVTETDPKNKSNKSLYNDKGEIKKNNAKIRDKVIKLCSDAESQVQLEDLTVEMLTTADGLAQLRLQAPILYETFNSFYGQSKPKMPRAASPFRPGELIALLTDSKGNIKKNLVEKIKSTGGFRLQSYSDFQIENYVDVLQTIFEASMLGLNGHAYTKVPAFLEATNGTNLKRNISIFMYEDGGNWNLDKKNSFPMELEDIYALVAKDDSGNTSIIAVSQNADMSAWIMANDLVGYGIPFHKSGLKMDVVRARVVKTSDGREVQGYSNMIDHTSYQSEVYSKTLSDKKKENTKVKQPIDIYKFWDFENNDNLSKKELIEKNVKKYIDECNKRNYRPKFRNYVMDNKTVLENVLRYSKEMGFVAQDATVEDISFKYGEYTIPYGYYKFLGDFGMFDTDGNAVGIEPLSLENYDFDKAVEFFQDSQKLRTNELLQQFENGPVREKYRKMINDGTLTTEQLDDILKEKRNEVVRKVVDGTDDGFRASLDDTTTKLSESGELNESRNTQELGEQRVGENNDSVWQRSDDSEGVFESLGTGEKMAYRSQEKGNRLIDWGRRFGDLNVYETREKEHAYGILRKISQLNIASRDSDGRKLSNEQKEFFKDTVAKNSKGELFTLYHATDDAFEEFLFGDFAFHIGTLNQALNLDKGTKKYLKEVYVNITNPVVISEDTMHWYGFAVANKLLEQHIITSKEYDYLETLDGFYTYDYNAEANKEIRRILNDKDYDGIVYNNGIEGDGISFMAFDSNQIKYTSNKNPTNSNNLRYSVDNYAPTFYSKMGKVIDEMKQDKIGTKDVIKYLTDKKRGVKAEEIKWSGIEAFLDGKKSVTKAELQEFVAGSQLQIEETVLEGGEAITLEPQYQIPNGEYSKDLYVIKNGEIHDSLTWNKVDNMWESEELGYTFSSEESIRNYYKVNENGTRWEKYKLKGGKNYREITFKLPNSTYTNPAMQGHWGKTAEGILAHARIQDFDVDGKKMLFIEEIQSDWHNEGHKKGYVSKVVEPDLSNYEIRKIGVSPRHRDQFVFGLFDKTSGLRVSSAIRRTEQEAWDELTDALIKEEKRSQVPDAPYRNNYHEYVLKSLIRMASEQGYDSIGWTPAEVQSKRWSDEYAEGYRIEYDQDIPKFLKRYGKEWGAKVVTAKLKNGTLLSKGNVVWSMPITETMKESVLYEGQALYSLEKEGNNNEQFRSDSLSGNGRGEYHGGSGKQTEKISSFEQKNKGKTRAERKSFTEELREQGQTKSEVVNGKYQLEIVNREAYNDDMLSVVEEAKSKGIEVVFFVGVGKVRYDGKGEYSLNGLKVNDSKVYVRYDHILPPQVFAKHEMVHAKWNTPEMQSIKDSILNELSDADKEAILSQGRYQDYLELYEDEPNQMDIVWEEVVADILSDMNDYTANFIDTAYDYWYGNESIEGYDPSTYAESIDAGGKQTSYKYDLAKNATVFPTRSDANTIALQWANNQNVKANSKRVVFFDDVPYMIEKILTSDSDNYRIVKQVNEELYEQKHKGIGVVKDEHRNKSIREKGIRTDSASERNGSTGRVKRSADSNSNRHNGETGSVSEVDRGTHGRERTDGGRDRNHERGVDDRPEVLKYSLEGDNAERWTSKKDTSNIKKTKLGEAKEKATGIANKSIDTANKLPGVDIPSVGNKKVNIADIVNMIKDNFDIPISTGKVTDRNASGVYKQKSEAIRTTIANNLPTISHELGHHLDKMYNLSELDSVKELRKAVSEDFLKQYPENQRDREAVAEFVRTYLRNTNDAKTLCYDFYDDFVKTLSKDDLKTVDTIAKVSNEYMSSSFSERVQSSIVSGETKEKTSLREKAKKMHADWVDGFLPIKDATEYVEHTLGVSLDGRRNAYTLATNSLNARAIANFNTVHGFRDLNGNIVRGAKSYIECIANVNKKNLNILDEYLVLKHSLEWIEPEHEDVTKKRVFADDTLEDVDAIKARIAEIESAHPEMKEAAENLYEYQRNILKYIVIPAGGMTEDTFNSLNEKYPFYVPFYRAVGKDGAKTKGSFANQKAPLKRAKGSGELIISPLESIIRNTDKMVKFALRNQTMQSLANYAETVDGFGKFMERVPPDMLPHSFNISNLKDTLYDAIQGVSLTSDNYFAITEEIDKILGDSVTDFTPIANANKQIVTVLNNGQLSYYQIHDADLYSAVAEFASKNLEGIFALSNKIMQPMKLLITQNNPIFAGTNALRDIGTAYKHSPINNPLEFAKRYISAATEVLKKGENYKQWQAMGGGHNSELSANIDQIKRTLRAVAEKDMGKARRLLSSIVLHPISTVASVNDYIESIPRVMEFTRTLDKGGDFQAAINNADDITTNFKRSGRGALAKNVNSLVMFNNAALQGLDKTARTLTNKDKTARTKALLKWSLSALLIAALESFWNKENDEEGYKDLSSYKKNNFYNFSTGDGKFISLPKARETALLDSFTERTIEYLFGNDEAFYDFGGYIADQLLPPMLPNSLNPIDAGHDLLGSTVFGGIADVGWNENFMGVPIESKFDEYQPVHERYNENTSKLAYALGQTKLARMADMSPKKIDHLISSYTGILGQLNKALFPMSDERRDVTIGLRNKFVSDSAYSNDLMTKAYDNTDKAKLQWQYDDNINNAIEYEQNALITSYISGMNKAIKALPADKQREGRKYLLKALNTWNYDLTTQQGQMIKLLKDESISIDYIFDEFPSSKLEWTVDKQKYTYQMTPQEYHQYIMEYLSAIENARIEYGNDSMESFAEAKEAAKDYMSDYKKNVLKEQYMPKAIMAK